MSGGHEAADLLSCREFARLAGGSLAAGVAGRAIATRRDRIDGNGIDGQAFHAWFTCAGKLRGGLEFLLDPPKLRAPWEKA